MKFPIGRILACAVIFMGLGCDAGEESDAPGPNSSVVDPETRAEAYEEILEVTVDGGADCLTSPIAGTCFDILHTDCFTPQGECTEDVPSGVSNTWEWADGSMMTFDYAGLDESGANWFAQMTGTNADGEECIDGVFELKTLEVSRVITLVIGGETLQRVDVYSEDGSLPYTNYICGDGTLYKVEGADITIADACFFGPYAQPCGFLTPSASNE